MSNQLPFPHILTFPKTSNGDTFRFVTDATVDSVVYDKDRTQHNKETEKQEVVYDVFEIKKINEQRKAKGVWDNWPKHPIYYSTTGKYLGKQFESDKGTDKFLKE